MLTLRATLEPDGHLILPPTLRHERPVSVLVTFLDEATPSQSQSSAAATLELLQSPTFRNLPKSNAAEIEQRIAELRNDWTNDDRLKVAAGGMAVNAGKSPSSRRGQSGRGP